METDERTDFTTPVTQDPELLGGLLREMRKSQGLTVAKLATLIGRSKGYISLVESGKRTPHWGTMFRMVHAMNQTLCSFLTSVQQTPLPEENVRSGNEQLIVVTGSGPDEWGYTPNADTEGYTWILTPHHQTAHSTVVRFRLPPHTAWTTDTMAYPASATAFGMEGRILLELSGAERNEFVLAPGEAMQFNTERPHRFRNFTDHPAECLLVVAPVRF